MSKCIVPATSVQLGSERLAELLDQGWYEVERPGKVAGDNKFF